MKQAYVLSVMKWEVIQIKSLSWAENIEFFNAEADKLWPVCQIQSTACFYKQSFIGTQPLPLVFVFLRARILKWIVIPFSKGSSWPRNWTQVFCIAGRFFIIWATWEAHLYIYPFFFRFFSHINYYRILNIVPWAIQWVLMYYIYVCVYIC